MTVSKEQKSLSKLNSQKREGKVEQVLTTFRISLKLKLAPCELEGNKQFSERILYMRRIMYLLLLLLTLRVASEIFGF
jgi:hypothetical protein